MKHFNTRKQLLLSVLSLLACVSMLVGSTFAWFTDSVTSGMNTIAAGNLDVELLADGNKVDTNTKLFDDVALWEPGVVVYENLQVANVGTLALKYQLSLNFGNENDLNGHKLSEVLKIAVLDEAIADGANRADVLAAAKAANPSTLSNLYEAGALEAGKSSDEQAFVIFWEPGDNDNDYNANNGQKTSDGEPLHIEFGINLVATQQMSEEDSFGKDYDEFASILPKANVINKGAQTVKVLTGYSENEIALDASFQFQPNETQDEALSSSYSYWHADFVISADKDVKANSIALAGYYKAWCGDNGWVVLTQDTDEIITAGTEIRLVQPIANVNYNEICQYGNDELGFLCGIKDLTGENAGTTLTVELRLYETTVDPANPSGNKNDETGEFEVVGTYTHTFPAAKAGSVADLKDALAQGGTVELTNDVTVSSSETGSNGYGATGVHIAGSTLDGKGNSLGVNAWGTWDSAINITSGTIKNLTVNSGMRGIFISHNGAAGKVYLENVIIDGTIYTISCDQGTNSGLEAKDSTFNGWTSYAATTGDVLFTDCSFGEGQGYAFCRPYAPTAFVGCNFEAGYEIDAVAAVTFENCTIDGQPLTDANLAQLVISGIANADVL